MRKHREWSATEHLNKACELMDQAAGLAGVRTSGNPPVGVVLAIAHAAIAQAKLTEAVIEVRS